MFICSLCSSFALAVQDKETIIKKESYPNEPIELVALRIKEKQVRVSESFAGDRDWYKNISLSAKNISGKTIVYLELELEIPESGTMERPVVIPFVFGELPTEASSIINMPASKRILPNEIRKLELTDSMKDFITNHLMNHNVDMVSEAKLNIVLVVFDDGLAWKNGQTLQQNPRNPREWKIRSLLKSQLTTTR
jgi:hypothetical protein